MASKLISLPLPIWGFLITFFLFVFSLDNCSCKHWGDQTNKNNTS
jgi:hypothetical protein